MPRDEYSLAHTVWNCKYHIVFAPKYRRQAFFGEKRLEIGKILRKLCEFKQVTIVEAEVCPDHIHMLVDIFILTWFLKKSLKIKIMFTYGKSYDIIIPRGNI